MLNILIVDDDFLVRTYLQQFIDWEKYGYHIIGEAKDGKKAYEMALGKVQPDIIITDVCMPIMGGVELVRELKKINHKAHIIILSGHDDFEYVKEAMRLGADEYLLKNELKEDKLLQLLDKLRLKIDQREISDKKMQRLAVMGREKLCDNFIRLLKKDNMDVIQLRKILQDFEIDLQFDMYMLLVILTNDKFSKYYLTMCLERISDEKYSLKIKFFAVPLSDNKILLIADFKHIYNENVRNETIKKIYIKIKEFSINYFSLNISMIIGDLYKGEKNLCTAYQEIEKCVKVYFYGEENILYASEKVKISSSLPAICTEFLSGKIYSIPKENYKKKVLDFLLEVKKEKTDPELLLDWLRKIDSKMQIKRGDEFYLKIKNINILEKIISMYSLSIKNKEPLLVKHQAIKMALDYIEHHYMENLSLAIIAEKIGLSPAYFSYLFKSNLGVTFLEYITNYRIEKVKILMLDGSKKLNEIAKCAGFFDYQHFCKVFKNITGKSPKNYRELMIYKSDIN